MAFTDCLCCLPGDTATVTADKWVLCLRRGTNVADARTTGVNEGFHRFFKGTLNAVFPCLHSRRMDGLVDFLFKHIKSWYTMREMAYELGKPQSLAHCLAQVL
jgi:hypothetical protein